MSRIMSRTLVITALTALTMIALGCGGGSGSKTQPLGIPGNTIVAVTPGIATLFQGATRPFTATVNGNTETAVVWSVQEGTLGGTIDQNGIFTAPEIAGTFHVVATLKSDSNKSGRATVTVPEFVTIYPSAETLGPQGTRQFVATVTDNDQTVMWSVQEGPTGGTITSHGLYTVPNHFGTFHVIATSVARPSKSATAAVSVIASGFALTGKMGTARSGHTATLLNSGKVLVAGGSDSVGNPLASAELFDPASGSFAPTGTMSTERYGATALLLSNGKVLIVGGFGPCTNECPRLSSAELYDPLTGTFSETGSMAYPRVLHTATLLNDGKVLITGGTIDHIGGGTASASAELYDPSSGMFSTVGSMVSDRAQHTATLLANGQVLIVGGWNGNAFDFPDDPPFDPLFAELFDPSSGRFAKTASMGTVRMNHSATELRSGMVLVAGGWTGGSGTSASAELYDLSSRTFSSAGNLALSRQHHTATLLSNGDVLIVGGENASTFPGRAVGSAELFDPAAGKFTASGGLVMARKGHTATLLLDGRLLVTGGVDSNENALATAELYK